MGETRRLLFLPGAGADPEFWRPLGDLLPDEWEKVYLGWPGIGDQAPHPDVRGFGDLVRMVVKRLGSTPVDLLAQSMGGAVALRIALDHPDRVRRIVLSVTAGGLDVASLGATDWRPAYRAECPRAASWILDERPDYSAELCRVHHPTLLLWGDNDSISPVAVGEQLRNLLPNSELRIVRGGDHAFVAQRPRDIVAAIILHLL
jgi:pimeloyl-ACP methyl ester carboxylesterase